MMKQVLPRVWNLVKLLDDDGSGEITSPRVLIWPLSPNVWRFRDSEVFAAEFLESRRHKQLVNTAKNCK